MQRMSFEVNKVQRRDFLKVAAASAAGAVVACPSFAEGADQTRAEARPFAVKSFEWEEATCAGLQNALASGRESTASLTEKYLRRIEELNRQGPTLRAVLEVNPDALAIAHALDRERKAKGPRGPLHGVPVLIKDNIGTHDRMMTTAGSLALLGSIAPRDSFVAQRLREAGAVILGKATLSEWGNLHANSSRSGWGGRAWDGDK